MSEVDRACPKTIVDAWHHVDISSRHQLITTSVCFRPPSWIHKCRKSHTRLAWVRRKNLRTKITEISFLALTAPDIQLGVIPHLQHTLWQTCNSRVNIWRLNDSVVVNFCDISNFALIYLFITWNQIKFIKSRRTKLVTNTAITVTQDNTMNRTKQY